MTKHESGQRDSGRRLPSSAPLILIYRPSITFFLPPYCILSRLLHNTSTTSQNPYTHITSQHGLVLGRFASSCARCASSHARQHHRRPSSMHFYVLNRDQQLTVLQPGCPMHKPAGDAPTAPPPSVITKPTDSASACPYVPPTSDQKEPSAASPSYISKLNPLNYMPKSISNQRDHDEQSVDLPLSREPSTIPRGDGQGNWEYPSPQQMYNAMLRKGYTDTPAEHVESMVAVHNFLNEGAWQEIVEWERRFSAGLSRG
jgi:hypothetical protein